MTRLRAEKVPGLWPTHTVESPDMRAHGRITSIWDLSNPANRNPDYRA